MKGWRQLCGSERLCSQGEGQGSWGEGQGSQGEGKDLQRPPAVPLHSSRRTKVSLRVRVQQLVEALTTSFPLHSQMFIGTSQRHALHCVSLHLLFHVRSRVQAQSLSICSNCSFPFPSENPCQRAHLLLEEEMQPWT